MRDHLEGKQRNKIRRLIPAVIAVLAVCLAICVFLALWESAKRRQAQRQLERLKDIYIIEESADVDIDADFSGDMSREEPEGATGGVGAGSLEPLERSVDFQALRARENADIYAWIMIPGTPVDYPVLQDEEEANYYLDHNINGSRGYPGCIYTELYNSKEWDDPNTVLYGHNMRNGTMFGSLHNYADPEFFEDNKYVYVYTPDKTLVYQIFAAYEHSDEHLVRSYDFSDEDAFEKYFELIYENGGKDGNFDLNVGIGSRDRIITLSTCIKNRPDRRYLVQAKLISE